MLLCQDCHQKSFDLAINVVVYYRRRLVYLDLPSVVPSQLKLGTFCIRRLENKHLLAFTLKYSFP